MLYCLRWILYITAQRKCFDVQLLFDRNTKLLRNGWFIGSMPARKASTPNTIPINPSADDRQKPHRCSHSFSFYLSYYSSSERLKPSMAQNGFEMARNYGLRIIVFMCTFATAQCTFRDTDGIADSGRSFRVSCTQVWSLLYYREVWVGDARHCLWRWTLFSGWDL